MKNTANSKRTVYPIGGKKSNVARVPVQMTQKLSTKIIEITDQIVELEEKLARLRREKKQYLEQLRNIESGKG